MNSTSARPAASGKSERRVFTVSRLNQEVQLLLESGFGTLWLQGEISNFSRPSSGHYYFSVKDSQSQVRCAMFRGRNRYVDFVPANGDAVLVRGKLGLYAARGDFQLIVEHMEAAGAGKLQAAFEATKRDLHARGWFDADAKQAVPAVPDSIGVITSPTGAAVRDVIQVLRRRYPLADIVIYPTLTQGAAAAPDIVRALASANRRQECDVLLLVRGGGSIEDLWAFNEVAVAEAIRNSELPVVAGVGHEIDITIADLVADVRAPTPSAAAELATPDGSGLQYRTDEASSALARGLRNRLQQRDQRLQGAQQRLLARHPKRQLDNQAQRIDEFSGRLVRALHHGLQQQWSQQSANNADLLRFSPTSRIERVKARLNEQEFRISSTIKARLNGDRTRLAVAARALDSVSPLAVLERGYAVLKHGQSVVSSVDSLQPGDPLVAQLADGQIHATVTSTQLHDKVLPTAAPKISP